MESARKARPGAGKYEGFQLAQHFDMIDAKTAPLIVGCPEDSVTRDEQRVLETQRHGVKE